MPRHSANTLELETPSAESLDSGQSPADYQSGQRNGDSPAPSFPQAPLVDTKGLLELLSGMVSSAVDASAKANAETTKSLVEALLESKRPYIDPGAEEVQRMIRENDAKTEKRKNDNIAAEQSICSHLQGSSRLSQYPGALTAIAKHRFDDGSYIGICLVCSRLFKPRDSDYVKEMQRPSGCRPSEAGRRG